MNIITILIIGMARRRPYPFFTFTPVSIGTSTPSNCDRFRVRQFAVFRRIQKLKTGQFKRIESLGDCGTDFGEMIYELFEDYDDSDLKGKQGKGKGESYGSSGKNQ